MIMEQRWCLTVIALAAAANLFVAEGITGTPAVINVNVVEKVVTWDLQQNYTGSLYYYNVLIYRVGHRSNAVPIESRESFFDLKSLKLSSGSYYIEVQAVTSTGLGPYTAPVTYKVNEKADLSSLIAVVAIGATLFLGILFGSLLFIVMLSKLRWKKHPKPVQKSPMVKPLGKSVSFQLPHITNSSSEHALNTSLNVAYSASASPTSLENSAAWLIPLDHRQGTRAGTQRVMTNIERIYDSIESLESSPPYVSDSDINNPDPILMQQLSSRTRLPGTGRDNQEQDGRAAQVFYLNQRPSDYLEVLPCTASHDSGSGSEETKCLAGVSNTSSV